MKAALAIFALTLLLALVAVVKAQHPCDAPREFESRVFRVDHEKKFEARGRLSYDFANERTAHVDEVDPKKKDREFFHEIILFHEKTRYLINIKKKDCKKEAITFPFRRFGVPVNATFVGEAEIGSDALSKAGVLTTLWEEENKAEERFWFGSFTHNGCLPVHEHYRDKTHAIQTSFFDITLGISNPNIFVPPKECA